MIYFSQPHFFPSLSGTFGIPTRLALNPKMPNEPSSPSHANARTEKHCSKIETYRLSNNNGQRTTICIKNCRDSSKIKHCGSFQGHRILILMSFEVGNFSYT